MSRPTTEVVAEPEFERVYQRALNEVWGFWRPGMQEEIARHSRGWAAEAFDFHAYLATSAARYYRAYRVLHRQGGRRVCDVGGFLGVFPLTLSQLGYEVTMTETVRYYSSAFHGIFEHLGQRGVRVLDYDPFAPETPLPGEFDLLTVMAVLEHYPHSLRTFLENVVAGLARNGQLFIEVPNVAFWPKRINLLRGVSPLASLTEVYHSAVPFIGHHREFTRSELMELASLAGLEVVGEEAFNFSSHRGGWKYRFLLRPLGALVSRLAPGARECLTITCRLAASEQG